MDRKKFIHLLERYLNKHKNASCLAGSDADGFIDKMHALLIKEYPCDIDEWLKKNLERRFLYAVDPPKWTRRGERDWPYFEGEPLVFLHQFSLGMNEAKRMKREFPVGKTIYVFGGKKKVDKDGWIAVYMMVGQDNTEGNRVYIKHIETTM